MCNIAPIPKNLQHLSVDDNEGEQDNVLEGYVDYLSTSEAISLLLKDITTCTPMKYLTALSRNELKLLVKILFRHQHTQNKCYFSTINCVKWMSQILAQSTHF